MSRRQPLAVARDSEKAVLVGVELTGADGRARDVRGVARRARAGSATRPASSVLGRTVQRRRGPDVRTFIGSRQGRGDPGAAERAGGGRRRLRRSALAGAAAQPGAEIGWPGVEPRVKVLDRSQLILDIFAQRARSLEGKLAGRARAARRTCCRAYARTGRIFRGTAAAASGRAAPARRSSRSTAGASRAHRRCCAADLTERRADARAAPPGARRRTVPDDRARRLHERGQVDADERAHRRRRAHRRPALRDARPDRPAHRAARRRDARS